VVFEIYRDLIAHERRKAHSQEWLCYFFRNLFSLWLLVRGESKPEGCMDFCTFPAGAIGFLADNLSHPSEI